MQEVDAERRLQTLRRLPYDIEPTLPIHTEYTNVNTEVSIDGQGRARKRRRIAGEDDTERDLRLAKEDQNRAHDLGTESLKRKKFSNASLTDRAGHINLFPVEQSRGHGPKNTDAEAEAAKKKKEHEDQYTMRFSNAAGFKQAVDQKPWYFDNAIADGGDTETLGKNVWGNEDPRRKEREKIRLATDDPLAMMLNGVQGLRQVEKERKTWKEERAREMRIIEKAERRHRRQDRRSSIDGFCLDTSDNKSPKRHRHHCGKEKSQHRHRYRSHERGKTNSSASQEEIAAKSKGGLKDKYSSQFAGLI